MDPSLRTKLLYATKALPNKNSFRARRVNIRCLNFKTAQTEPSQVIFIMRERAVPFRKKSVTGPLLFFYHSVFTAFWLCF